MKNVLLKSATLLAILLFLSCSSDDGPTRNDESIIPVDFLGRTNEVLGNVDISSRKITISVWDHGKIDGDIISVYVNGKEIITEKTLDGPLNKFVINTTLEFDGYNYLLLYAHNEGSISPNTAAISIDDGTNKRDFILRPNLSTNGAVDLIVN